MEKYIYPAVLGACTIAANAFVVNTQFSKLEVELERTAKHMDDLALIDVGLDDRQIALEVHDMDATWRLLRDHQKTLEVRKEVEKEVKQ